MDLSDDKRTARISIEADLTADELETLLCTLAKLRSTMVPVVPSAPRLDALLSSQEDGGMAVRALSEDRIQLLLQNAGLGWLSFILHVHQAVVLRDFLIQNTPNEQPATLVNYQVDSGNLPQ